MEVAADVAQSYGLSKFTTHVTPPQTSQVGRNVFIAERGHDPEWIATYRDPEVRKHDPIPDHVMRVGETMTFEKAVMGLSMTVEQEAFIEKVKTAGLWDSVAIPVYGPFDFDTFATFTLDRPLHPEDDSLLLRAVTIVEISNRRVANLLETEKADQEVLSSRELEVLNWMGRSKSNADIGTILAISTATVDTYVRRIFAKLNTFDRISAVIKGVRLGMIRY